MSQRPRGRADRHGTALVRRGQPARATAEGLRLIHLLERGARREAGHLAAGRLAALVPDRPHDVALYWQYARAAAAPLAPLTRALQRAAGALSAAPSA